MRLFTEAIGATSANGRYCQVAVRPDWSDSTDLFGHVDLNGNFVPGAILPLLKATTLEEKQKFEPRQIMEAYKRSNRSFQEMMTFLGE